jgi:hypothetical protein
MPPKNLMSSPLVDDLSKRDDEISSVSILTDDDDPEKLESAADDPDETGTL